MLFEEKVKIKHLHTLEFIYFFVIDLYHSLSLNCGFAFSDV